MKPQQPPDLREIELKLIRPMIRRTRGKEGWEQIKHSMAEVGLKMPVQVRELDKPDADGHRFELIAGEGRLTAAIDLKWKTIPALVIEAAPDEIAGRFLAENMIRKPQSWNERAKALQAHMKDTGCKIEEAAKFFGISLNLAVRYQRVLTRSRGSLAKLIATMPMNEAESFTALPEAGQTIVLEVAHASGATIKEVTAKARELNDKPGAGLTKASLEKSIRGINDHLDRLRQQAKAVRLHQALGPGNVQTLLMKPEFRKALAAAKVSVEHFESVLQ